MPKWNVTPGKTSTHNDNLHSDTIFKRHSVMLSQSNNSVKHILKFKKKHFYDRHRHDLQSSKKINIILQFGTSHAKTTYW